MTKFLEWWGKYSWALGWIFTAFVVALLLWGHLGAKLEVPLTQPFHGDPMVGICKDAPAFAHENLDRVVDRVAEVGHVPIDVQVVECGQYLFTDDDGRTVPRLDGWILISLRDKDFSEEHAGETVRWGKDYGDGPETYAATILLPPKILGPDDPMSELGLPRDAEYLVLLHEYIHAWGYDHTVTRLFGPFIMEKTGHAMTRSIYKGGDNIKGVGAE